MSKFKQKLKEIFLYEPVNSYDFMLAENSFTSTKEPSPTSFLQDSEIFSSLDKNYDYLKVQYNSLINSDILLRPFVIDIYGKKYNALFVGIDGMISSELTNNFLLRPLLETNSENFSKYHFKNGVQFRKVKKINIEDYIFDKLLPQNSVKKASKFSEVLDNINRW